MYTDDAQQFLAKGAGGAGSSISLMHSAEVKQGRAYICHRPVALHAIALAHLRTWGQATHAILREMRRR